MDISQLLPPLGLGVYIEVVETFLPDVLVVGIRPQSKLLLTSFLAHASRKPLLQDFHHHGRIAFLRYAEQQMKMFGHHYVAYDHELVPLSCLFENLEKQVALARRAQQRPPTVTTA